MHVDVRATGFRTRVRFPAPPLRSLEKSPGFRAPIGPVPVLLQSAQPPSLSGEGRLRPRVLGPMAYRLPAELLERLLACEPLLRPRGRAARGRGRPDLPALPADGQRGRSRPSNDTGVDLREGRTGPAQRGSWAAPGRPQGAVPSRHPPPLARPAGVEMTITIRPYTRSSTGGWEVDIHVILPPTCQCDARQPPPGNVGIQGGDRTQGGDRSLPSCPSRRPSPWPS